MNGDKIAEEDCELQIKQAGLRVAQAESRVLEIEARSLGAIAAAELSYRRLFEAAKDGILILNVDTGRIDDVNPFLFNLLGFSRSEMINKTVGELSPFKDIESNKIMLERLQKDGYVRYENLPLETRDGKHLDVEFVSNVYMAGNRNVIQCNIRDITERKQAEEKILKEKAELEEAVAKRTRELALVNEELEAFSYSVSHDLQAPLRHIQAFITILKTDLAGTLSEKNLKYLAMVFEAAKRMSTLIDDLLAFSHIGKSEMVKTSVNLDRLTHETAGDFHFQTSERKICWEIHKLPQVQADRALLRLVLVNLMSNAVKFTGKCANAKIEIGCMPGVGETVIFVRDNGAGFDPKYASKLFGVFQRMHGQKEFEGTGIGLANVQRIIHRHGGRVWAESSVGKGATFYFSLPNKPTEVQ